jgi:LysM repeat protein
MRKILLVSTLFFFCLIRYAAASDSLGYGYLNTSDTVFVKISEFQEKLIEHRLQGEQTLYAISKYYGMTVNEIFDYNPEINQNSYSPGVLIKIPIPAKSILTKLPSGAKSKDYIPLCYVVKKSDTLYKLSKLYFGIPVETLVALNKLVDNGLSLGQVIHIGWMSRKGIPASYRKFKGGPADKKNQLLWRKYTQAAEIKREHHHKGVAFWQADGIKSVDLYAMHRHAPIGSIIAITNPMTNRTVYAQVIAAMPESIYSEDVAVVVSTRVAQMLGAKDARFYVKVKYLK